MYLAPAATREPVLVSGPKAGTGPRCIACTKSVGGPLVICDECLDTWTAFLVANAPEHTGRRWRQKVVRFYLSQYGPSVPGREREAARSIRSALKRAAERMPDARRASLWRQLLVLLAWGAGLIASSILLLSVIVTFGVLVLRLAFLI